MDADWDADCFRDGLVESFQLKMRFRLHAVEISNGRRVFGLKNIRTHSKLAARMFLIVLHPVAGEGLRIHVLASRLAVNPNEYAAPNLFGIVDVARFEDVLILEA